MTPQVSERVLQAVFTVCTSDEVTAAVANGVLTIPGASFIGHFPEYITGDKQPHYPEVMKSAVRCIAFIDCNRDFASSLETMTRLKRTFIGKLQLVAVASKAEPEFLIKAMRAGCADVLTYPIDQEVLTAAMKRFTSEMTAEHGSGIGTGRIITLGGVKGGVGTTTLAVHLAMHLVRKHRKKVLLIDHRHELGHAALHLGVKNSTYYFDDLVRNVDRLDTDLIDGFVMRHNSGLELIPSPDSLTSPQTSEVEDVKRVMQCLKTRYDYVLVDASFQDVARSRAIVESSDEIALVCTPDVVALRDLVRRIEQFNMVDALDTKLKVVINRSTSNDAISTGDIESIVRYPVSQSIPNNYADLMQAINQGEPVSTQKRCSFTSAFARWSERLVSGPSVQLAVEPERKRRFLSAFM